MTIYLQKDRDHIHYMIWSDEDIMKLEKRVIALENTLKRIGIDITADEE